MTDTKQSIQASIDSFRCTLDECHEWPCPYVFKFIGPKASAEQAERLFPEGEATLRPSRTGKYVSVTAEVVVNSADEVIEVYTRAKDIPGLICL